MLRLGDCAGDIVAGRIGAAHRHQRAVDAALRTALRSALNTPPPTSSRITAGIGRAGHEWAGHLAAPVDMGAADGKQFWAASCGVILRQGFRLRR